MSNMKLIHLALNTENGDFFKTRNFWPFLRFASSFTLPISHQKADDVHIMHGLRHHGVATTTRALRPKILRRRDITFGDIKILMSIHDFEGSVHMIHLSTLGSCRHDSPIPNCYDCFLTLYINPYAIAITRVIA